MRSYSRGQAHRYVGKYLRRRRGGSRQRRDKARVDQCDGRSSGPRTSRRSARRCTRWTRSSGSLRGCVGGARRWGPSPCRHRGRARGCGRTSGRRVLGLWTGQPRWTLCPRCGLGPILASIAPAQNDNARWTPALRRAHSQSTPSSTLATAPEGKPPMHRRRPIDPTHVPATTVKPEEAKTCCDRGASERRRSRGRPVRGRQYRRPARRSRAPTPSPTRAQNVCCCRAQIGSSHSATVMSA